MESTDLMDLEAFLTEKDFGTYIRTQWENESSHSPVSSDVSLFEPLTCIASCYVMGFYSSLLEEHMAIVQRRLMQVTRPSKSYGRPHGCRSDAAHMGVAVAVAMAV